MTRNTHHHHPIPRRPSTMEPANWAILELNRQIYRRAGSATIVRNDGVSWAELNKVNEFLKRRIPKQIFEFEGIAVDKTAIWVSVFASGGRITETRILRGHLNTDADFSLADVRGVLLHLNSLLLKKQQSALTSVN